MSICKNCGQEVTTNAAFCGNCGTALNNETTTYPTSEQSFQPVENLQQFATQQAEQPIHSTQQQNTQYQQMPMYPTMPVYSPHASYPVAEPVTPRIPTGLKVKGFIGMGLSIEGFIMAIFTLFYAFLALSAPFDVADPLAFVTIYIAIIQIAASIIGFCLSLSAKNGGFKSGAVSTGFILGIIGMSIYLFSIFLAIMVLAM